jgi:proteic killer suppression protein
MVIHFRSKKLEKKLSSKRMIKRYYANMYNGIVNRLTELQSVSNLSLITHLPPPRRHRLSGEWKDCWAVDVSKNHRLIFSSYIKGITNEKDVEEIIIEVIEDYH